METLIGFIAGYLVGTREGKAGLARLRESVDSIRRSPTYAGSRPRRSRSRNRSRARPTAGGATASPRP